MSVATGHIKDIIWGDGERKDFPFSFEVLPDAEASSQVKCKKVLASGVEVDIARAEYEIEINEGNIGGKIIYPLTGAPLSEKERIVIYRDTEMRQDFDPSNKNSFNAYAISTEIDRSTMTDQELAEKIERAVLVPMSSDTKPEDLLKEFYDNVAEAEENVEKSRNYRELAKDWAIKTDSMVVEDGEEVDYSAKYYAQLAKDIAGGVSFVKEKISVLGDGSNTITLDEDLEETAEIDYINIGNVMQLSENYTLSEDKKTITFVEPVPVGSRVEVSVYKSASAMLFEYLTKAENAVGEAEELLAIMDDKLESLNNYAIPANMIAASVVRDVDGWLPCEGGVASRVDDAALFAKIGTKYGVGDGKTTFNLPDFRGCVLRGYLSGTTAEIGKKQAGGAPNIIGEAAYLGYSKSPATSGSLGNSKTANGIHHGGSSHTALGSRLTIDASKSNPLYGAANEIRMVNHAVYWLIKR